MIEWAVLPLLGVAFVLGAAIYLCRKNNKGD